MAKRWGSVSLRTKITGVTVFILTLGLVVAGAGTLSFLRPQLIAQQDTILTQLRADPTPALASGANTAGLIRGDVLYAPEGYYVAMLDGQGELVYDNFRAKPEGSAPAVNVAAVDVVSGNIFSLQSPNGEEWHAVATPVTSTTAGPQPSGILLIAQSTSLVNSFMVRYITIFSGFGFAVILLGAALTRILVTSTFEPLAEVERTAAEIAKGDFSKRIQVPDEGTEVGHLGRSLNTMLDRIDDAFDDRAQTIEQMRRFIGDASHELRTPLVSVRGYAELYRMGALQEPEQIGQAMERIEKEAIRMGSLVEDLLALARLDERRTMQMQPLNLIPLARDAAMDTMAQAPDRLVRVIVDPSALTASGDALPPAFAPALASGPAEPAAQDAPAPDAGPREPAVPEPGEATAASEARTPGRGLNLRGVGKLGSNGTRSWTAGRAAAEPKRSRAQSGTKAAPKPSPKPTSKPTTPKAAAKTAAKAGPAAEEPSAPVTGAIAGLNLFRQRRMRKSSLTDTQPIDRSELLELREPDVEAPPAEEANGTAPIILGDENKVRQTMTNLLGNALRYSPEGTPIEIAVAVDAEGGSASFEIRDHGEGIPPQIREKIFERFWRADNSRNRETGGSGLGLAIVSSIVDAHQGRVSAHETAGGGATFRVELPLLTSGDPAEAAR